MSESEFEKWWREDGGEAKYVGQRSWIAALKWARIKVENYTPDDILYFIDEELEKLHAK